MRVIILAAGKGERLYPLTRNTPKSLLDLGNGLTVVESQLENIREAGVRDVVIVAGYKAEQIEAKVASVEGMNIEIVYNPFFDESNNLVSAWFARQYMSDDFVLLNGDDVFDSDIMRNLLESRRAITMVIDRKDHYDDDDMKVRIDENRIVEVSKMIAPAAANGESIGMFLFREKGCQAMRNALDRMVRFPHYRKVFYLQAIQKIIDDGIPVHFSECAREQWAEIDFHPDLKFIQRNVEKFSPVAVPATEA